MAKTHVVGVRMDTALKAAMEREAQADERSLSSMISKILADWLKTRKVGKR